MIMSSPNYAYNVQCLSGDTQIWCDGDKWFGINKKVPLRQLYENNNHKTLQILSYDKTQGEPFVKNIVDAVICDGEALLYQVVTSSGATILATENHQLLNYTTKAASPFFALKSLRLGIPIVICSHNHKVQIEAITEIREYGIEPLYHIRMAGAPHNFVANGFVVHDSIRYGRAKHKINLSSKR